MLILLPAGAPRQIARLVRNASPVVFTDGDRQRDEGRVLSNRVHGGGPPRAACGPAGRGQLLAISGRTHGLPPQSPPSASPRSAVPAGTTSAPAGGTTGETRCLSQALRLQVVAARASRSPSTTRSAARPRAWPSDSPRRRMPRRRLARPAAPQPPPPAPERSPATAGGTGTDVRGDRPGRSPQVALERHHAAPSCGRGRRGHGRRAVRPRPAQPPQRSPADRSCSSRSLPFSSRSLRQPW